MRAARRRVCLLAAAALLGCRSNGDGRPPCEDGAPRQDGACTADGEVDTGTGPDPATTDDDGAAGPAVRALIAAFTAVHTVW